ncbi:anti-sigma factor family protein [Tuwongella immobilis]|uniref:Putative zinc-finger domain-containing protein n=1 Tax=Tuwongella immobilis TaxID=692036 RepID=A0A6C2YPT4_9BACT|nr:zf-HC2 domain-containing protein [Tuwongella immobilis]VIP03035.1 Uncharacterized protein OS=Rhodopirellula baltica SWK14 GN=RBSWK_06080 PE=4 SV=1: zf-HC2 [Tuwongella immobilis]VTS03193.1 Uncharacterized protein OS=Rhodopirellula baltica SWK14 GN=RBSWK_06080 PE=4 SV=1: zf-HC2 [Tuwongella immobilis]
MNPWSDPNSQPLPPNRPGASSECDRASEAMHAQLDGECSASQQAELEAHLEQCPPCRREWAELQSLLEWVDEAPPPAVPPLLTFRIATTVVRDQQRRRIRKLRQRAGLVAIAASILVAVGISWLGPTNRPTRNESMASHATSADPASPSTTPEMQPPIAAQQFAQLTPQRPTELQSLEDVRSAVLELTKRPNLPAMDVAYGFWSAPSLPESPKLEPVEVDLSRATEPLDEAAQSVAVAFEPVASSTRRAIQWVVRDLPTIPQMP